MIKFVILASCIAIANGGVGLWNPEIEKRALFLYREICLRGDRGFVGETSVFCKKSNIPYVVINRNHSIFLNSPPTSSKQIIFVRPQSHKYQHTVFVNGKSEHKHNTTIYVVPQTDQHSIDIVDKRKTFIVTEKPSLFYLNSDPHRYSVVLGVAETKNDPVIIKKLNLEAEQHDSEIIESSLPTDTATSTEKVFPDFYIPQKFLKFDQQRRVNRQTGTGLADKNKSSYIILSRSYSSARKQGKGYTLI